LWLIFFSDFCLLTRLDADNPEFLVLFTFTRANIMRVFIFGWLCVFSLFGGVTLSAAETVTAGGIGVTIPDGWDHADSDRRVVLTPRDLPQCVGCTLTLLGGKALEGSVTDEGGRHHRFLAGHRDVRGCLETRLCHLLL
jgi:hypothetical protein